MSALTGIRELHEEAHRAIGAGGDLLDHLSGAVQTADTGLGELARPIGIALVLIGEAGGSTALTRRMAR